MLAYELFHNNINSTKNNPKKQFPIKKIFYKNNKIIIDKKGREEYGSETTKDTKQLQDWLQMPLNTIDVKQLNLPDFRTGAAGANPYIEVYGDLKTNKSSGSKLVLSIGKKPNQTEHVLNLTDDEVKSNLNEKTRLKLDPKNYFLNTNTLFSEYISSGLVDKYGTLNIKVYDGIIQKFLEFTKKQKQDFKKINSTSFRIYILPDDSIIKFKKQTNRNNSKQICFIDYFGNSVSEYASTPTKTTKFLSYDDPAFTINCMQKLDFYKNLGIGNNSLEKVYTDSSQTFNINRLDWTFIDISDPTSKFVKTSKGILTQLYENYILLSKNTGAGIGVSESIQLKIICIRINQAKQELLVDENLTMNKMKEILSNIKNIPPLCFEILIDNSNKNPIWDTYLYAVKNFLAGNKIPKIYLISFFTKMLKQNRYELIKLNGKSNQKDFFLRSDFCIKFLTAPNNTELYMDQNEKFAKKVGQIASVYIEFKQNNKEIDNSLLDILTYSKYDREKLRFVIKRIGLGIQLSKINNNAKKEVTKKIRSLQPIEEIEDGVASKDYSYFFFKGYYSDVEIIS